MAMLSISSFSPEEHQFSNLSKAISFISTANLLPAKNDSQCIILKTAFVFLLLHLAALRYGLRIHVFFYKNIMSFVKFSIYDHLNHCYVCYICILFVFPRDTVCDLKPFHPMCILLSTWSGTFHLLNSNYMIVPTLSSLPFITIDFACCIL